MLTDPVPLAQIIGARLRRLRAGALLRQDDIATAARRLGFTEWARGTVAMVESGRRRVTAEELVALPEILYAAGIGNVTLSDLIGPDEIAIGVNDQHAIPANTLRDRLRGAATSGPVVAATTAEGTLTDTPEVREALAAWRALGAIHGPSDHDIVAAIIEARGSVVEHAAKVLGCSPITVSVAAIVAFERLLISERDDRVRSRIPHGTPGDSPAVQAIRGHVTRELLAELRPVLKNVIPKKKTRRARR